MQRQMHAELKHLNWGILFPGLRFLKHLIRYKIIIPLSTLLQNSPHKLLLHSSTDQACFRVLPTLMIPDSTWSYLNPHYNRLFIIKYVMEKKCNEDWLQFMLQQFWIVLAPSVCSHSSPHTRCAVPHNMGLHIHDFIGHPNETALPAHPSPHLLFHRKSSIKFSYLKKSAQKGLNVSVTTCFISLYYFQNTQTPMLSSERFTCSSGACSAQKVQLPLSHCKPHHQKVQTAMARKLCQLPNVTSTVQEMALPNFRNWVTLVFENTSKIDANTDTLTG